MDWIGIIPKLLNPVTLGLLLGLIAAIVGIVVAVRKYLKQKKIDEAWEDSGEQRIKEEQESKEENQAQDEMAKKDEESIAEWKKRIRKIRQR